MAVSSHSISPHLGCAPSGGAASFGPPSFGPPSFGPYRRRRVPSRRRGCCPRGRLARRVLGFIVTPPPIHLDRVTLRRGGREVVRELTGTFAPGSLTAVVGPTAPAVDTAPALLPACFRLLPAVSTGEASCPPGDRAAAAGGPLSTAFPDLPARDVIALGDGPLAWVCFVRIGSREKIRRGGPLRWPPWALTVWSPLLDRLRCRPASSSGSCSPAPWSRDAPVILLDEPFSAIEAGVPRPICWRSSAAGIARAAPSSRYCTTSN